MLTGADLGFFFGDTEIYNIKKNLKNESSNKTMWFCSLFVKLVLHSNQKTFFQVEVKAAKIFASVITARTFDKQQQQNL